MPIFIRGVEGRRWSANSSVSVRNVLQFGSRPPGISLRMPFGNTLYYIPFEIYKMLNIPKSFIRIQVIPFPGRNGNLPPHYFFEIIIFRSFTEISGEESSEEMPTFLFLIKSDLVIRIQRAEREKKRREKSGGFLLANHLSERSSPVSSSAGEGQIGSIRKFPSSIRRVVKFA